MSKENLNVENNDKDFEEKIRQAVTLTERDHIKSFIGQLESDFQQNAGQTAVVRPMNNRRWMAIAASFLLLAAAFFTFQTMSTTAPAQVADEFFEAYPNTLRPITRGEVNTVDMEWRALAKYEGESYEEAYAMLSELPDQNDEVKLFTAISAYQTEKYPEALNLFSDLIKTNSSLLRPAQWYKGLTLLKTGEVEKAKEYIKVLADQPSDSNYKNDAVEVLKSL